MAEQGSVRALVIATVTVAFLGAGAATATAVANVIEGTPGDDVLTGTPAADSIRGFDGADVLSGRGARDIISGHAGDDALFGDAGRDLLSGGDGDDVLRGGGGPDLLTGGGTAPTVETDRLHGGHGPDFLGASQGPDRLYGGGQDDKLFFEAPRVVANGGYGDDWLWAFYDEESSATGSTLRGAAGDDLVQTHVGDTALWGGRGDDTLKAFGTDGVRLVAGAGDDTIESNYGIDTGVVNDIDCGPGVDTARVGVQDTVAADCEVVLFSPD